MKLHGHIPNSHIHVYICERFIHSHGWSDYFAAAKEINRSWEYINRAYIVYMKIGIGNNATQFHVLEYINRVCGTV
jgi:hypothetical protein